MAALAAYVVGSLVWVARWHYYPLEWWKNSVKGFLGELSWTNTIPFADIGMRFREGKGFQCRNLA